MSLKLRVVSDHHKALGRRSSKLFGVTGGRIGRAQDNDWVLPDPDRYVSSHHCKIVFRAGQWVLEDTSTNGVFINGSDAPSSMDGPYSLLNGDRLRLGEYEIAVSIDEHNDFSSDASGQVPIPPRLAQTGASVSLGEDLGEELDLTDLLQDPAPGVGTDAVNWASGPTAVAEAQPKVARPAAKPPVTKPNSIESLLEALGGDAPRAKGAEDWQMQTRPYDRATMTALTQNATARRRIDADMEIGTGFEAFCRGAGIDPTALPSDAQNTLLALAGQMIRETVIGLIDAHKGRADLKHRLRLTTPNSPQPDANPLKTANSVDEAVLKLLDPHATRQLGPVDSIRESFAEHRTHQTALVTAIHAGIDELMKGLEPRDLQERFDRGLKRGALLGATNKMKYWDLFAEFFQVVNQRNEQGLPALFAEELARTYAERSAPKKK
jgi:type VI secretion system FHA domain protein